MCGSRMKQKEIKRGMPLVLNVALLVSGAVLISGFLGVWLFSLRSNSMYESEMRNNLIMLTETLTTQLAAPLVMHDTSQLEKIMHGALRQHSQIVDVIVVSNNDGKIYYDLGGTRDGKIFRKSLEDTSLTYISRPITMIVGMTYGLKTLKKHVGVLLIGVSRNDFLRDAHLIGMISFAESISENIAQLVSANNYGAMQYTIRDMLGGGRNIRYVQFLNREGDILYFAEGGKRTARNNIVRNQRSDPSAKLISSRVSLRKPVSITEFVQPDGEPMVDIGVPVSSNGNMIGVLRIGYSMSNFMNVRRRNRFLFATLAVVFVLIGLVFALHTAVRISRPIQLLAASARRVGEGDLNINVNVDSGGRETRELGNSFNQMIAGLKERDMVKDTFSRYVTKQVADEILKDPSKISPGGKKQDVTILFSDIRGFTAYSEMHTPEEVVLHLNEYLSSMVDVIFKYEGTLDKFIGDAIMAVFGAPISHSDDPLRAVRTALEMLDRLKSLNEKWANEGKLPLAIGIGINTGEVIVGNIGDVRRMEYTVIGDNVNMASRIEGLTKNFECPIIISKNTYEKVSDQIRTNNLGTVTVKGKSNAIEIYELLGLIS